MEKETLLAQIQQLQSENNQLKDYLAQARQHRFGRKSEKFDSGNTPLFPDMDLIFDEPEKPVAPKDAKPRKKHSGGRKPLPKDLPREDIIHDLDADEKQCKCGHPLHKIGEEVSEQLEIIPAQAKVLRHVRHKYGCKGCEDTVLLAPLPPQPIPKSKAGPGLLAHTIISKYADHLPLYRQEQMWERAGIDLDRVTLGRWTMTCGKLLLPLVQRMKKDLLSEKYLQADETKLQVLSEKGRLSTSKSYMWLYKTVGRENLKIVYDYSPSRSATTAQEFLGEFEGWLQSDAYSAYKRVAKDSGGKVKNVFCWAHARRKFADIVKSSPKATVSIEAVKRIGELYEIEADARKQNLPPDKIRILRQEKSKILLEELKVWLQLQERGTPPKGVLGNAIRYILKNWENLICYLEDGRLEIDNNGAERCIKPFVIGRKNWLFEGNARGAEAGAVLYSLIETCKSHKINPFEYISDVLKKIVKKDLGDENLKNLLPYHWKKPVSNA